MELSLFSGRAICGFIQCSIGTANQSWPVAGIVKSRQTRASITHSAVRVLYRLSSSDNPHQIGVGKISHIFHSYGKITACVYSDEPSSWSASDFIYTIYCEPDYNCMHTIHYYYYCDLSARFPD